MGGTGSVVLFGIISVVVLGGAIGVVTARNPVHSALFLVSTLIGVAGFFLMQDADLVAVVQIVVYASAIVVLFLFVIMLLGVDRNESLDDGRPVQRIAGAALAALLGIGVVALIGFGGNQWATGQQSSMAPLAEDGDNMRNLAEHLFTDFLWPFEVTSVLLVIAVVGGVVLARRSRKPVDGAQTEQP